MEDVQPLEPRTGRLSILFLAFIAGGLLIGWMLTGSRTGGGPMEGQIGPEVTVDVFTGGTWRLSEHLATDGRPVVLNLWASWCVPCREEIPELSAFAQLHPEVAVVGVAVRDERDAAAELARELKPSYTIGIDQTSRLRDLYVGFGMPTTYVIDRQGTVVKQYEGPVTVADLETLVLD